ncbi:MAG: hypothetical protein LBG64_00550 [Pseudomonadales bacterium]|jgi:hypothetical protein|nr:hypothetical protein [Pseudomonadales bacterium]
MTRFYSTRKKLGFALCSFVVAFGLFAFSGVFYDGQNDGQVLGETIAPNPENCLIKGDVNSRGQRIYYLPECTHYDLIVVNPLNGDAWFCTEEDAIEAGFTLSPSC